MNRVFLFLVVLWTAGPAAAADQWFRGNTHAHTTLCDHADSSPAAVTKWYHDHGYNFLILSEHNRFIDPEDVEMPENARADFILISGEEVTGEVVHSTAMNIPRRVTGWGYNSRNVTAVIQRHADRTLKAGGIPILNHPNYLWMIRASDIRPVTSLYLFELYNANPPVNSFGDDTHPSMEHMWDTLLTDGMLIYGLASDDAHQFKKIAPHRSNPGRGWVMVRAPRLDPDEITKALLRGDFYASSGVFLTSCVRSPDEYVVEVDPERTQEELSLHIGRGRSVEEGTEGYRVEFVGEKGAVIEMIEGTKGVYRLESSTPYVRARVTLVHRSPEQGLEEYYAWGQPVFTDDRAEIVPQLPRRPGLFWMFE